MLVQLFIKGYPLKVSFSAVERTFASSLSDEEGVMFPVTSDDLLIVGTHEPIDVFWTNEAGDFVALDDYVMPNNTVSKKAAFAVALRAGWFERHLEPAPVPSALPIGDAVAAVTKAVGIQPCGGCKERQASLNKAGNQLVDFLKQFTAKAS